MAITVSVKTAIQSSTGSVTIDHAAGNDRALLVLAFEERNPNTLATATFDGDAATYTGTAYTASNCRVLPFIWNDAALPAGSGSFTLTSSANTGAGTHYLVPIYLIGVDQTSIGSPTGITGGTTKATPISQAVSGASVGDFCVIAAIESSASSANSLLSNCTFAANTAVAASMYVAAAYSITATTVGYTSDDTYEGWTAFALSPTAGGGAADITSVTGPGSVANTVRATESFTIAGTGFEASQGAGTVTIGGVSCSVTAWGDTSITATAPTAGLMFGGSKTITVTPDSNTADSIASQTYLPLTGYDYRTYSGSGAAFNTLWWNKDTAAPVAGLAAGDQSKFLMIATLVGGSTECAFVPDANGVVYLEDVTEPGDYENDFVYLRDASDGLDSAAYTVTVDSTAPTGYSVSIDQALIDDSNDTALSFTFAGAEVGSTYEYTITSSGGGTPVTDTGTILTATDQITGIDVSGLGDGTLTLSVTLTDPVGNEGPAATSLVAKGEASSLSSIHPAVYPGVYNSIREIVR